MAVTIGDIQLRPRKRTYSAIRRAASRAHAQFRSRFKPFGVLADAWCSAFVWPKPKIEPAGGGRQKKAEPIIEAAPTNALWLQIQSGQGTVPPLTAKTVVELTAQYHFFHWHLAFPQVFAQGGFDVVLGNPPWEALLFEEQEFFAPIRPDISQARTAAARKRLIATLEEDDPELFRKYRAGLRRVAGENAFVRSGVSFPLCGVGRVNLFGLFAEAARRITRKTGRIGQVLPSGIVTDDSTKLFFQAVTDGRELVSFLDFENHEALFPAVHRQVRFGLLTLAGPSNGPPAPEFVFFATNASHTKDPARRFSLSVSDIALLNPLTRTCPSFRFGRDAKLAMAIYRSVPVLARSGWQLELRRLLNAADDSDHFLSEPRRAALPLYEGKYFHQYDHRWVTHDTGADRELTDDEHRDPEFAITPRYWYPATEIAERFANGWRHSWALALRSITNAANERTLIAAVVPSLAIQHSAKVFFASDDRVALFPALIANLSAFVADYVARQKLSGWNMSVYIAEQIPIIQFADCTGFAPWDTSIEVCEWLGARAMELTYHSTDLASFARELGYEGPPFRWDPDRRFLLRAELDAAFFHLYGISRDDTDYIMETFPVVRKNDEKAHREYRTKRVILEIYDEMVEAIRTGKPYLTRLDPPPGDPRLAHPGSIRPSWASAREIAKVKTAKRGGQAK